MVFAHQHQQMLTLYRKWYGNPNGIGQITHRRIRRNLACPCFSGKKYKNCCGSPKGIVDSELESIVESLMTMAQTHTTQGNGA